MDAYLLTQQEIDRRIALFNKWDKREELEQIKDYYIATLQDKPSDQDSTLYRAAVESLVTTGAVCFSKFAKRFIDPLTISKLQDDKQQTPLPPNHAFVQVIKGAPNCNFTTEELLYVEGNVLTKDDVVDQLALYKCMWQVRELLK